MKRRVTRKFEVSVSPCSSREQHLSRSTIVSVETRGEAIERGIEKMYGSACFWFADLGLPGYGQIFEALKSTPRNSNPGNSAVTYRARLDVKPLAQKSRAFLKQEAEDRSEHEAYMEYIQKQRDAEQTGLDAGWSGAVMPTEPSEFSYYIRRGYSEGKYARNKQEAEEREEREREGER